MRKILPERTVATFVELLRAYKRKTFPAMDVAQRVASLLKGYPELIRDFEHFLPARDASRDFLRSAAAKDPGIVETEPPSEYTQRWSERAAGSQPDLTLLAHDVEEAPPTDPAGDAAARTARAARGTRRTAAQLGRMGRQQGRATDVAHRRLHRIRLPAASAAAARASTHRRGSHRPGWGGHRGARGRAAERR